MDCAMMSTLTKAIKLLTLSSFLLTTNIVHACPNKEVVASDQISNSTLDLQNCQRLKLSLECQALITSSENTTLGIRGSETRIVDYSGNEYFAKSLQIGGQKKGTWVRANLVKDIPLKLVITFTDIPPSVTQAALLQIGGSNGAKLRNIPIEEQQLTQRKSTK